MRKGVRRGGRLEREGTESSPRVNHVDSVLESDPDDVVLSEVSSNGGESLSNLVGFIGLRSGKEETVSS